MRIAAHSSPVTYAGQKSAKTPYFVEKKCLTALGLAPGLTIGPGAHGLDRGFVAGIEAWPDAMVVVHIGHPALDMMLDGLDGGLGGAEPELLVRVEAETPGDVEDSVEWQVPR